MPRGPKKHLKRLNAPKHWMLGKLGGIFVSSVAFCGAPRHAEWPNNALIYASCGGKEKRGASCARSGTGAISVAAAAAGSVVKNDGFDRSLTESLPCLPWLSPTLKLKTGPQALAWTAQAARVPAAGDHAPKQAQVSWCFFFFFSFRVVESKKQSTGKQKASGGGGGGGQSLVAARLAAAASHAAFFPGLFFPSRRGISISISAMDPESGTSKRDVRRDGTRLGSRHPCFAPPPLSLSCLLSLALLLSLSALPPSTPERSRERPAFPSSSSSSARSRPALPCFASTIGLAPPLGGRGSSL